MKPLLTSFFVLTIAVSAFSQEKEKTTVTTTTKTVAGGVDLLGGETFNVIDATPFATHAVDLRLAYRWQTANAPANSGDSNDDHMITPEIVWGPCENVEVSAAVPIWVGDAGKLPGGGDGNADSYVGVLWRFKQQEGMWPSLSLGNSLRLPTGDDGNGLDWEFRLSATTEHDSGLRSHFNIFGVVADNDNVANQRDFQYGAVAGLDGPLCNDCAVRWILDYQYRISDQDGGGGSNVAEGGWQWQINEDNKLGMSIQAGLDHAEDDTANMGAALTYAYTLRY